MNPTKKRGANGRKGTGKDASSKSGKPSANKAGTNKGAGKSGKGQGDLPGWMPESMRSAGSAAAKSAKTGKLGKTGRNTADSKPASTKPAKPTTKSSKRPSPQHERTDRTQQSRGFVDPHAEREARRYEQPIPSREAILHLLSEHDGPMRADEVATALQLEAPDRRDALDKRLRAMLRDGQLLENRRGGLTPAQQVALIPGSVIANPDGFGFLRPEEGGDDLFLPPAEMRKAMHGDRVLACVTGIDHRGRREGAVVEVLDRRLTRLIGRYEEQAGVAYVIPDDARLQRNIMLPPDARGDARHGQLVVVELTEGVQPNRPPFGRLLAVLGEKLTASLAVEAAIHGHDLPHEFSQAALDEALAIPLQIKPGELVGREDLRELPLVTIDGEDSRDFDDAVWCEPNRDGFRLIVAIADVSWYVCPGSALDEEAQLRATSVYFPGFVLPMLPETLSNGICSLNPGEDRLCMVCDMQVGRDGLVSESRFYPAVMRSHARLTYNQVWNVIGEGIPDEDRDAALAKIGDLLPQVEHLHQLYKVLAKARAKRGAIEFETSEVRFELDAKGEVTQAGMLIRNDAHKLIEECMIAANVQAAALVDEADIPAPYRVHDKPPEAKYADLLEFLKEFKLRMPPWNKVRPRDYTALLEKVRERPDAVLLESVLLRSQALAVYQTSNIGHFGLALEQYAHFTSPIRRYADLLLHRAIRQVLDASDQAGHEYAPHEMAALALQCSEKSRRADEAQREVDDRYRAAWMEEHVGSQFDGVISGVTSFGLFVELEQSKVNGLVHVTQLPHDYYQFDALRKTLTGERGGRQYRLGDRVRVVVLKASLEERKIDFRLVADDEGAGRPPKPPPPRGKPARREKQPY